MAYAFDTLGYAKRLREAGVQPDEAEAHAEAAMEFIMTELVTKQDLDIRLQNTEYRLENRISGVVSRVDSLSNRIDALELRLLVRLGGLIAIAVAILAAIIKL
jgi:hypothetical protein